MTPKEVEIVGIGAQVVDDMMEDIDEMGILRQIISLKSEIADLKDNLELLRESVATEGLRLIFEYEGKKYIVPMTGAEEYK